MSEIAERCDLKALRVATRTDNQNEAQEAVHQAILKAYQQLKQFREDYRYLNRLIEITLNQCLMKLEK
jgi:DNA-directed RNA polymerase specialized sigma24 family protein